MQVERSSRAPDVESPRDVAAGAGAWTRWLRGLVGAAWFVIAMLGFGEVVLRTASHSGILLFDTEMWRYARAMKRPSSTPGVVLEHRPNVEANLMGVRLRTDARGFRRAAPDLEAVRTGNERVVAIVGDSCALGWGVPEGGTVGEDLERSLDASAPASRRVTVVNAGVGNSNTAMEYARYLRDVRPLHPVWVILGYFINDAEPDPSTKPSPILEHSVLLAMLATRGTSLLIPTKVDFPRYYDSLYAPDGPGLEPFIRTLRAFGAAVREDGAMATILLIPEMHEPRNFGPFADIYRRVAALAAQSGFEVVDPSGDFPAGSGRAYWVSDGDAHPNRAAHAVFAAALARSDAAVRLMQPHS
jgi:lysophospholipase L1-like esterase